MKKYLMLLLVLLTPIAMAEEQSSYLKQAKKVGENIWIGPQPTAQDFSEFAAEEIGAVVNTRTAAEMQQLDFNEVEQAAQYNMTYDLLEVGENHAYSPAKLEAFNGLMTANAGKQMVLHCRSGHRASQLYAAWLIKYQGQSTADALKAIQSDETELNDSIKTLLGQ
jgi:uncharacterized protein (TIGR01244 family)